MSQMDVNALLTQMRGMAAQSENRPEPAAKSGDGEDFGALMKSALQKVDGLQDSAGQMSSAFERGDPEANLSDVMVAVQKADLSFRAMSEVRNKLVSAYKEIMNMPV